MAKPKAIPCQIAKPHTPNTRENSNRVTFFRAAELAAEPAATCTATSAIATVAIFFAQATHSASAAAVLAEMGGLASRICCEYR